MRDEKAAKAAKAAKAEEKEEQASTKITNAILTKGAKKKLNKLRDEKAAKAEEGLEEQRIKDDIEEELINQFDGDSKFPSSFESLLNAYSLIQNIGRNYRDLRPIFNNLSVLVFNDLNDVLDETNELIKKSVESFNVGKSAHTKKKLLII